MRWPIAASPAISSAIRSTATTHSRARSPPSSQRSIGPSAGYFARRSTTALALTAVAPERDSPSLPFTFAISMAVRRGDEARRAELDAFLERRRGEVNAILDSYGVPRLESADHASR